MKIERCSTNAAAEMKCQGLKKYLAEEFENKVTVTVEEAGTHCYNVYLEGELIYSKEESGPYPKDMDVSEAVRYYMKTGKIKKIKLEKPKTRERDHSPKSRSPASKSPVSKSKKSKSPSPSPQSSPKYLIKGCVVMKVTLWTESKTYTDRFDQLQSHIEGRFGESVVRVEMGQGSKNEFTVTLNRRPCFSKEISGHFPKVSVMEEVVESYLKTGRVKNLSVPEPPKEEKKGGFCTIL